MITGDNHEIKSKYIYLIHSFINWRCHKNNVPTKLRGKWVGKILKHIINERNHHIVNSLGDSPPPRGGGREEYSHENNLEGKIGREIDLSSVSMLN